MGQKWGCPADSKPQDGAASLPWTVVGLLSAAAVFSSVHWVLARHGDQHRKRCGERVAQAEEG